MFHRGNYKCPTGIVNDAERHLAQGKRVMFLATCSYMLEPLRRTLRQRGLPFFNPYRRKRVDWNPLAPVPRGASAADRLLSFLKPHPDSLDAPWAGEDLRRWTTWLRADPLLLDGAMEAIKKISPTTVVTIEMLRQFFEPESLAQLLDAVSEKPLKECVQWWLDHLAVKKRKQADYPARVALRRGVKALKDTPHIIIGTGHSVKGGEADVVYVFPDLSASGMSQWEGSRKERDALIRLGYVMITRARESLVICEPASAHHMPLAGFAARVMREHRGNTP